VQSFDSLPEDAAAPAPMMPLVMKNVNKKSGTGPLAHGGQRRSSQWKLRPINEALEAKRRKIIAEFFETERSYVNGLNLIHSVRAIVHDPCVLRAYVHPSTF
jgi:FYVE/RhoGEF/PH domain-containing protein 5/6